MRNVLARIVFLILLVASTSVRADALCPLGWTCEIATDYELGKTIYADGIPEPGCSLHHVVRLKDPKVELHMIAAVRTTAPVSVFSFIVGLIAIGDTDKRVPVPLKDLRIISANRAMDTKDWEQSVPGGKLRAASRADIVSGGPVARAATDIATGGIYGVLLQPETGGYVRFEIRGGPKTEKERLAAQQFRDCAENGRAPPPGDADRG
jgi:hypothetical protein